MSLSVRKPQTLDDAVDQLEQKQPKGNKQPQKKAATLDDAVSGLLKKKDGTTDSGNGAKAQSPTTTTSNATSTSQENDDIPSFENSEFGKALLHTNNQPDPTPKETAIKNLQDFQKVQTDLTKSIVGFNDVYGTKYDPKDILSSADKSSEFLHTLTSAITRGQQQNTARLQEIHSGQMNVSNKALPDVSLLTMSKETEDYIDALNNHIDLTSVKEAIAKGESKDETISKIAKRKDPYGFKKAQELTSSPQNAKGNAYNKFFEDVKQQDNLLNAVKDKATVSYNNGLQQLANNKISEGILSNNQQMIDEGYSDMKNVDKDAVYKSPILVQQMIVQKVSNAIARKSGLRVGDDESESYRMTVFGASIGDKISQMKEEGYFDDPRTKDQAMYLAQHPDLFSDASYLGGAGESFISPFKGLFGTIGDITGFRSEKNIYTDRLSDKMFPKEPEGTAPYDFKVLGLPINIRHVANTTANLAGMATIAAATEGIGTELGLSTSAAQRLGAYTSFGLPSYDENLKDAHDFIDNPIARTAYAAFGAILNAEGGKLLDLGKLSRVPELEKIFSKAAIGLTEKTLTEDATKELLDKGQNKFVNYLVKYGKNVTKGAATMAYFNATNNILKIGFGDPNTKISDVIPQAAHAFIDGVTGMSMMGLFGAAADMRNEKNTTYKDFIYNMALNHDAASDVLKIGLKKGEYTQDEYNKKVSILNTAIAAKKTVDLAEQEEGKNLTPEQKSVYVANKTAENFLRDRANKTQNEELKSKYEAQADRLNKQNKDIFNDLHFSTTLEPLYELHDAQKKYNEELQKHNESGGTDDNEALIAAKDKYDELNKKYLVDGKLPSNDTPTPLSEPIEGLDKNGVPIKKEETIFPARNDDFADKYFTDEDERKKFDAADDEGQKKMIVDKKEEINSQTKTQNDEGKEKTDAEKVVNATADKKGKDADAENASASSIEKKVGSIYTDKDGKEQKIIQVNNDGSFLVKENNDTKQNPTLGNENDLKEKQQQVESKSTVFDDTHLKVSADAKTALNNGVKKQIVEADENGKPVVNEVDFTKEDADVELDRLEALAKKGKLTPEEFQKSYFGQRTDTATFGQASENIKSDAVGFVDKLRKSFDEPAESKVLAEKTKPTGKAVEIDNNTQPEEAAGALQGTYDRLLSEGSNPKDPEMIALKQQIDGLSKAEPKEGGNENIPPTENEEVDNDSSHPTEVSLQRKSLLKQVQDIFFKPTDGSKSIADETVLNNAVNTLTAQALENKTTIDDQLKNNINEWHNDVFDENRERRKDANGSNIQKPLTNEQQAQLGIYSLKLAQRIKDLKVDSGSPINISELENLENEQLKVQMLTGVVGESLGSGLRYLSQIYRFTNDGNFEVFRKMASSMIGADIPLEEDAYKKFREGLSKNQQKAADILHDALVRAKKITDDVRDRVIGSDEMYKKLIDEEVQRQVKSELEKINPKPTESKPKEDKKYAEKAKSIADKFRKLKSKPFTFKDENGKDIEIQGSGVSWNDLVELGAKAIEKTGDIADGIKEIVDKVKNEGWYQKLSDNGKKKFQDDLTNDYISETKETPEAKNIARLEKQLDDLRQGKRTEIKDKRELSKQEQDLKDRIEDEKKKLGILRSKKSFPTDVEKNVADEEKFEKVISDIKEFSKNANTNELTKDAVSEGLVKKLFIGLGNRGIDAKDISTEASKILKDNGIEVDTNELNEAYLKRGKYNLGTLDDINKGEKSVTKQITEHEKLQYDISELDKKIKEVNDTGNLSLTDKSEKVKELNAKKEAKYKEFEKVLREKGIKLEHGSKESREAKMQVIKSYNDGVKELGDKIQNLLNDGGFDNLKESQKNFIRSIENKLKHTINASDLNGQMDLVRGKVSMVLNDLFKDHSRKDKAEDISLRSNKGLLDIHKDLKEINKDFISNRQKTAEDIQLSEYKKRLESQKNQFVRRKAAGEFDNTKQSIDVKKDAEAYDIQTQMNKAKYDFYREAKRAAEQHSSNFVKFLRGTRELTRNLLLSGVTYIQGKLALSAVTRNIQIPSRYISSLAGKLLGVESVRNRFDVDAYWRGMKETVRSKSTKEIASILQKSGNELESTSNALNKANDEYKEILKRNNGDEHSKEALQFKTEKLDEAQAKYEAASLKHAVNNIYNHINPRDKGGRWLILKQGVTKEEAELGMLGKKENFRDYLHEPYDDNLDNEQRIKEMNKRINTLPKKAKRAVQAIVFASKSMVRFHGVYKDLPSRQATVEGYIKRLKAEQENPNGLDISDPRVQNKLWADALSWDGQEAKFQDKNKVVDAIRAGQKSLGDTIGGKSENLKEIADVLITSATPVLKVPFNIYHTGLQYKFGWAMGAFQTFDIMSKARGEDLSFKDYLKTKMTDEQRYKYFTVLGRGTVGAALMATSAIMMRNGSLVMGGQYPDPKKSFMLPNGKKIDLQYGDIYMNGIQVPHWLSLAINHLPNFASFNEGYYLQEDYLRNEGGGKGGDVLDNVYNTAVSLTQREVAEIPDIPLERKVDKYGETALSWQNPYSYLGYFGAVKDVERAFGAGQDKAKDYELTPAQHIYDNMGLLFLVPSEKESQGDKSQEVRDNLQDVHAIRKNYPYIFKKGTGAGMAGGNFGGGGDGK